MTKFWARALLKTLLGFSCLLPSLSFAQDHPLIAAVASTEAITPAESSSNNSSSHLPDSAITAIPIEAVKASPFVMPQSVIALPGETSHHFWDRENTILFSAVGAAATADFFATRDNLASGGRELNPVTRVFTSSTPLLAANFAFETAGVIGISYMFHKTGHHKLERLTSLLDIGGSVGAVTFDRTHR
jgi:hypothetical protein